MDGGTTHWGLPVDYTFSDLDIISRSQQCQTVLTENCMFLSNEIQTLCDCWLHQEDQEYTTVFEFCTWSREIIDFFSFEKTLMLALSQTPLKQDLSHFAWL